MNLSYYGKPSTCTAAQHHTNQCAIFGCYSWFCSCMFFLLSYIYEAVIAACVCDKQEGQHPLTGQSTPPISGGT